MARLIWLPIILVLLPIMASAGPAEDANAVLDRWSSAYTANDPDTVTSNYWLDAILLGTVSPIISEGQEAILKYFAQIKGSGNKNAIQERHTIPIDDSAVLVTGFYEFTRMQDGKDNAPPFITARTTEVNARFGHVLYAERSSPRLVLINRTTPTLLLAHKAPEGRARHVAARSLIPAFIRVLDHGNRILPDRVARPLDPGDQDKSTCRAPTVRGLHASTS